MATTQSIKLDETTRKRLRTLGAARSRTPHWLMRMAIEDYLDREEKYEHEKIEDMKRWENYQLTGKSVSHAEATQWLKQLAKGKARKCPKSK